MISTQSLDFVFWISSERATFKVVVLASIKLNLCLCICPPISAQFTLRSDGGYYSQDMPKLCQMTMLKKIYTSPRLPFYISKAFVLLSSSHFLLRILRLACIQTSHHGWCVKSNYRIAYNSGIYRQVHPYYQSPAVCTDFRTLFLTSIREFGSCVLANGSLFKQLADAASCAKMG